MKKLLYIVPSAKPEELSSSQRTARIFINQFLEDHSDYELQELNLYKEYIPEPNYRYFVSRAQLVSGQKFEALNADEKKDVERMQELCDLFKSADRYVIAAPMWTLSFPYKLKQFIDCIVLNEQTISISPDGVKGLLNDKERKLLYVQASAAIFPFTAINVPILGSRINHGVTYIKDVFTFLGFKDVEKLLVEGTEIDDVGSEKAIEKASSKMKKLLKEFE
jgi:FMN-dependent NADH-azoreductase